jgi:hypothetical protein
LGATMAIAISMYSGLGKGECWPLPRPPNAN